MRNRASTHLLLLLLIVGFEIVGYVAVYDSALLRGYEPSVVGAVRDLLLYVPLIALLFWLSRVMRFKGNWTLFTCAVLLFSIGLLVQYRLYSDPEYGSGNKAEARAEKTQVQRMRFINQFYRQRWQIESLISRHKRVLGATLRARLDRTQKQESLLRVLNHNMMFS